MDYHERSYKTVCKAVLHLSKTYVNLAFPVHPTHACDLWVESALGCIYKVKVLCTESKAPSGSYVVSLRKNSYLKQEHYKHADTADMLFIESPDGCYLIPSDKVENTRSITLSMYEIWKIIPG